MAAYIVGANGVKPLQYINPSSDTSHSHFLFTGFETDSVYKGRIVFRPLSSSTMYIRAYDSNSTSSGTQFQCRGNSRTHATTSSYGRTQNDIQTFIYIQRYNVTSSASYLPAQVDFTFVNCTRAGKAFPTIFFQSNWVYSNNSTEMHSVGGAILNHPTTSTTPVLGLAFWIAGTTYQEESYAVIWKDSEIRTS